MSVAFARLLAMPSPSWPEIYINHFVFVGDESWSMNRHKKAFIKVFDGQIAHLAARSKEYQQETRVTVYLFNSRGTQRCVVYDLDVLRIPSINGLYHPDGGTALIDCMMLAVNDMRLVPQKYGQHAICFFGLTDGEENQSLHRPAQLAQTIGAAPDNETYGVFVPDQHAVFEAKRAGFPAQNIAVWDTSSADGIEEVGLIMRQTTDTFMEGRTRGVHGYNARTGGGGLFRLRDFSASEVTASLAPLTKGSYFFLDVKEDGRIDEFVARETGKPYQNGTCFYQFMKTETIQGQKQLAVLLNEEVYTGRAARSVLGLPDTHVRVRPDQKPGCTIFVQSTSYNRKLISGTRLLVLR